MSPVAFISNRLREPARPLALVIGVLLIVVVAWADWYTGPQLDFALFYLLPVGFVTWFAGVRLGLLTSLLCAAAWLYVDRETGAKGADSLLIYSNLAMRLVFFLCSVLLLGGWKHTKRMLSLMVERRTSALRELASELSAAEDAQRRKLAYDMHDALSQSLSLIKMNLDAAQLESAELPEVQHRLTSCGEMIDEVIKQTRTLMFDLHPAMLDDLGLTPTLQWYAREFERRTRAEIVVSEQGVRRSLPDPIINYLFRALKELLSNAVRHGHAHEIIVVVHWEQNQLRLVVDDDGGGFDVSAAAASSENRGLGLAGITERIHSMGGELHLESRPGQGSRVIIEVPYPTITEEQHAVSAAG